MANRLKNILTITAAAGATVVTPHDLQIGGVGVVPDVVQISGAGASLGVTADATNVTVVNSGAADATLSVLVEHWHTVERTFGTSGAGALGGEGALTPQPFLMTDLSAGGGFLPLGGPFLVGVTPAMRSGHGIYVNPAAPNAADDGSVTTPKLTITGAIAAIVAVGQPVDVATNNQRWTVFVAPGCYDEDVTIPVTVPWISFVAMGGVTLGDGNANAKGASTTPRTITWLISNDYKFGTDVFGDPIPPSRLGFFTMTPDGAATFPNAATVETNLTSNGWRISGDVSVNAGGVLPYTGEFYIYAQGLFVDGNFRNIGAAGTAMVYLRDCIVGLLTTFSTNSSQLVRAENCIFGANSPGDPTGGVFNFGLMRYGNNVQWVGNVTFVANMATGAFADQSGLFNCGFGGGINQTSVVITSPGAGTGLSLVVDENTLAAIAYLGTTVFPSTNAPINVVNTPSNVVFGNTDLGAAAGSVFMSPGFESAAAVATDIKQLPVFGPDQSQAAALGTLMVIVGFSVRHNIAAGNGSSVTYEVLLNGASTTPAMTLALATGAVGNGHSTFKPILNSGNKTISLKATKPGGGIASGVINATAVVRYYCIND